MSKIGPNDPCWCGSDKKYKKCHRNEDRSAASILGAPSKLLKKFMPSSKKTLKIRNSNPVLQGKVGPKRAVPESIARPDYAVSGTPGRKKVQLIKTSEEIERMRKAGQVAREVLSTVLAAVRVGITTDELDAIAHEKTISLGGYPSPLNYHHFPKSICTSVNEVICHGIPDDRQLQDGDIVNCDVTVFYNGMHGDCSETVFVGDVDEESKKLVKVTHEAMMAGIGAIKHGGRVNDIGKAITEAVKPHKYGIVKAFVGHGIGEVFHMDPQVPHYYDRFARAKLRAGMTFTVEPMINMGVHGHNMWNDNWTAVTKDLERSAQFEHTLLVTKTGIEILTLRPDMDQPFL